MKRLVRQTGRHESETRSETTRYGTRQMRPN